MFHLCTSKKASREATLSRKIDFEFIRVLEVVNQPALARDLYSTRGDIIKELGLVVTNSEAAIDTLVCLYGKTRCNNILVDRSEPFDSSTRAHINLLASLVEVDALASDDLARRAELLSNPGTAFALEQDDIGYLRSANLRAFTNPNKRFGNQFL